MNDVFINRKHIKENHCCEFLFLFKAYPVSSLPGLVCYSNVLPSMEETTLFNACKKIDYPEQNNGITQTDGATKSMSY